MAIAAIRGWLNRASDGDRCQIARCQFERGLPRGRAAWVTGLGLLSALLIGPTPSGFGQSPDNLPQADAGEDRRQADITGLISQLAHPRFETREQASQQLSRLGLGDLDRLEGAWQSSQDAEQRSRLERIVEQVQRREIEHWLDRFLAADSDPAAEQALSAWEPLSRITGRNRMAKQLLAELYRSQPRLAGAITSAELPTVARQVSQRLLARLAALENPSLGDGVSLLLAAAVSEEPLGPEVDLCTARLVQMPPIVEEIDPQRGNRTLRGLVAAWILRSDVESLRSVLYVGGVRQFPEVAAPIRRAMDAGPLPDELRADALVLLAQYGDYAQDRRRIEPLLQDRTLLLEFQLPSWDRFAPDKPTGQESDAERRLEPPETDLPPRPDFNPPLGGRGQLLDDPNYFAVPTEPWRVEVRDVALAALIELSELPLSDLLPAARRSAFELLDLRYLGYPRGQPQRREEVLQRWQTWQRARQGETALEAESEAAAPAAERAPPA
jgi:hypothetical protein